MADTESSKAALKPAKASTTRTSTKKKVSPASSTPKKTKSDVSDAPEKASKKTKSEASEAIEKILTKKAKTPSPTTECSTPAPTVKQPKIPSAKQDVPTTDSPTNPKSKPSKNATSKKIIKKHPKPQPEDVVPELKPVSEPKVNKKEPEIEPEIEPDIKPDTKHSSDYEEAPSEDGHESNGDNQENVQVEEPESILESATSELKPEESDNEGVCGESDNDDDDDNDDDHDEHSEHEEHENEDEPSHTEEDEDSEDESDHLEDKPDKSLDTAERAPEKASEISGAAGPNVSGAEKLTKDKVEETTKSIGGLASTKAAEKAGELAKGSPDATNKATESAKDIPGDVQDKEMDAAGEVSGKAEDSGNKAKGVPFQVQGKIDDVTDTAADSASQVADSTKDLSQNAQKNIGQIQDGAKKAKGPGKNAGDVTPRTPSISSEQGPHSLNIGVDIPLNTDSIKPETPDPSNLPFTPSVSSLSQCNVNNSGEITDSSGNVLGKATGELENISGKKLDSHGNVVDDAGKVVGRVSELLGAAKDYMEGMAKGLADKVVNGSGQVVDQYFSVCGRCAGDITEMIGQTVTKGGLVMSPQGEIAGYVVENYLLHGYPEEDEKKDAKKSSSQGPRLPRPPNKESGSQERTVVGEDSEHPTDLFLNIQSTKEGISMTIRIPTGFLKGQAVDTSDIKV